jgi:hypothetical protein
MKVSVPKFFCSNRSLILGSSTWEGIVESQSLFSTILSTMKDVLDA